MYTYKVSEAKGKAKAPEKNNKHNKGNTQINNKQSTTINT